MAGKKSYDSLFKLLLIGDSSVGKTCLITKYVDDDFNTTFISTIGIDFKIKTITLKDKIIKLQIWDTAGQERFRTITASYYRGAMGILLVYSVSQRSSFENISNWIKAITENASHNVQVIIVGNKADMEAERAVTTAEGQEIARKHGALFVETSAKTGLMVNEAFQMLSLEIMQKQPALLTNDRPPNTASLTPGTRSGMNSGNCNC